MSRRIVAVTGANRGLGYALVKRLLKESSIYDTVVLCTRDRSKGVEAYNSLKQFTRSPRHLEIADLDTSSEASIASFTKWVESNTGTLTSIVHNAGIMVKEANVPVAEKVEKTAQTNLFGIINLNERLLSANLIQNKGKILHLSSKLGNASFIRNAELKERIKNVSSLEEVLSLYEWQLQAAKDGTLASNFSPNFPFQEYSFQKLLLSKYTKELLKDQRVIAKQLEVYSLCPGWCKTDMGGDMASDSVESGTNLSYLLLNSQDGINPKLQGKLVIKPNTAMDV